MIARDERDGGDYSAPRAEVGLGPATVPAERARTNLALLYGGARRGPLSRILIGPPDRLGAVANGVERLGF
jgi:hypothetical protein